MKLYILRHFERDLDNPSFESPLIKQGIDNALKKNKILKNLDINLIFSSPFIRCIQSVDFFSKINNKSINIDFSLCEYFENSNNKNKYEKKYKIPDKWNTLFNINTDNMILNNNKLNENIEDLKNRIFNFIKHIINKYKSTDLNILIVTHMSIVNVILYYFDYLNYNEYSKLDLENYYEMGKLLLVYQNFNK